MNSVGYRYQARSVPAFLKQLRHYVESGHYFYFRAHIKPGKDPERIAEKLLSDYRIMPKPYQHTRRYRGSLPSIHLLMHQWDFVIIATYGVEPECDTKQSFFRTNASTIRDIRVQRLDYRGYAVSYPEVVPGKRKFTVRLNKSTYEATRADLLHKATKPRYHDRQAMEDQFRALGFEGYAPVQHSLGRIVREVNKARRRAGLELIGTDCVPSKVTVTKVFVEEPAQAA